MKVELGDALLNRMSFEAFFFPLLFQLLFFSQNACKNPADVTEACLLAI